MLWSENFISIATIGIMFLLLLEYANVTLLMFPVECRVAKQREHAKLFYNLTWYRKILTYSLPNNDRQKHVISLRM